MILKSVIKHKLEMLHSQLLICPAVSYYDGSQWNITDVKRWLSEVDLEDSNERVSWSYVLPIANEMWELIQYDKKMEKMI